MYGVDPIVYAEVLIDGANEFFTDADVFSDKIDREEVGKLITAYNMLHHALSVQSTMIASLQRKVRELEGPPAP
jgi:hypothetical protein